MLLTTKNLPQLEWLIVGKIFLIVEKNGINKEGLTILPSLSLRLMKLELSMNIFR